jgi:DNA sulfur modification protein DndD
MDAPLSAFDNTRIQTICDVLPQIAEQVIIFINDKDGEIAEANLKKQIGKKYVFRKENEFETYMEEKNV